jgi:predicted homoserine dehydrogenase-like protein
MNYERLFAGTGAPPVRVGIAGVGEFGVALTIQARRLGRIDVCAFADRDVEKVRAALLRSGMAIDALAVCDSRPKAMRALERGLKIITADPALLAQLPLDVVVEATGQPEAAAANAAAAIAAGQHVVMASKEADSVVGPELHRRACAAGVVYTPVDGDQPSLLIKLVSWARVLGLRIVAAGKASEYDFVHDGQGRVCSNGACVDVPGLDAMLRLGDDRKEMLETRRRVLAALPQKTVPDYCELAIVCNATGMTPDRPDLHAPVARSVELPDLFCGTASGGMLEREGTVDIFNCLRHEDEISFAGGVFAVVEVEDPATFEVLKGKCIPASSRGSNLLIYNPTHLLGMEAPISILAAALLGQSSLAADYRPVVDLVGRARVDLPAGTRFEMDRRHAMRDVMPELVAAAPLAPGAPLPYYLAAGGILTRTVRQGAFIAFGDVEAAAGSILWGLRAAQDVNFPRG